MDTCRYAHILKQICVDMYEVRTLVPPISLVFAYVSVSVCVRERERVSVCVGICFYVFVRYNSTPCVCVHVLPDKSWHLRFDAPFRRSTSQNSHMHTHTHVRMCMWLCVTVCVRKIATETERKKK